MAASTVRLWTLAGAAALALIAVAPPAEAFEACPSKPLPPVVALQPKASDSSEPANIGELKREAINYKCFGSYDHDVAKVLADAEIYVDAHAGDAAKAALVLDIDETSLSNWPVILNDDFAFIREGACELGEQGFCGWAAWQASALDQPIAPTLRLFNDAKAKGLTVFFVTGRREIGNARPATEANLRAAGYSGYAELIMQPADGPPHDTVAEFKAPARAKIEAEGYTIIANVGDQWSDLAGGHAQAIFKVPNPFYFIP